MAIQLLSTVTISTTHIFDLEIRNIPTSGKDLLVTISARNDNAGGPTWDDLQLYLNDTDQNKSGLALAISGSSATASFSADIPGILTATAGTTANRFSNNQIYISNYAAAQYKTLTINSVIELTSAFAPARLNAGLWGNTAPITWLSFRAAGSYFVPGTTMSIYIVN